MPSIKCNLQRYSADPKLVFSLRVHERPMNIDKVGGCTSSVSTQSLRTLIGINNCLHNHDLL